MLKRRCILLALSIAAALSATAQQSVLWSIDFATVFENREGSDKYLPSQTIFQTRLAPEVGLSFLDGAHSIVGGAVWTQPCNGDFEDYDISATVYYQYQSPMWRIAIGMFPRTKLIEPMNPVEWSDLKAYNEPNIRGVLLQFVHPNGFFEASIDWRSMQSATRREAFNANINGRWHPRSAIMTGGRAHLNHLAKSSSNNEDQSVNDDIMLNPFVAVDLAYCTPFDSLVIEAGPILQLERDRGDGHGWRTPAGVLINAVAEWNVFGIEEMFYAGQNLFPLYPKYGDKLNLGDPTFQSHVYSRTTLYAYIFRNQFMNLEGALDFHVARGATTFWQKIVLRVYIGDKSWKSRESVCTRDEYLRNIY